MWLTINKRRRSILSFIKSYTDKNGVPPTFREIGGAAGITSTCVVSYNVQRLVDAGLIKKYDNSFRSLSVVDVPDINSVVLVKSSYKANARRTSKHVQINVDNYFGSSCAYCGESDGVLHREHFIPVSRGGKDKENNMLPACSSCNLSKNASDPVDWTIRNFGQERLSFILKYLCSV